MGDRVIQKFERILEVLDIMRDTRYRRGNHEGQNGKIYELGIPFVLGTITACPGPEPKNCFRER